jgi:acyl-CoA thioesterase-1
MVSESKRWRLQPPLRAWLAGFVLSVSVSPEALASPVACESFPGAVVAADGLRPAARLLTSEPFVIVAIGSSSTEGAGASARDRKAVAWIRRLLGSRAVVHNKGVGGQLASEMLARFATDVWPLNPQFVIWQTGTNDALRGVPLEEFRATLRAGIKEAGLHAAALMLVDPQYSRSLEEKAPGYARYVETMRAIALETRTPLIDTYAAMRRWTGMAPGTPEPLLHPDRLHLNDEGHRCVGQMIADFIAGKAAATVRVAGDTGARPAAR